MNKYKHKYKAVSGGIVLLALAGLGSCDKKEIEVVEVWEDHYVEQPVDTVAVVDNPYLDNRIACGAEALGDGRTLNAVNLFLDGGELFVANAGGRSVDVFDAATLTYLRSFSHDGRTDARDVCAEGDHLFVAAGDSREVQIFDRRSGAYLTRLGTGSWTGNVSFAGCVAATGRFVFVRDSKAANIRVFDREAIDLSAASNNTPYASIDTDGHYIDTYAQKSSNDMAVTADSLYVFIPKDNLDEGLVYAYSLADIERKQAPFTKTRLPGGMKIYSAAPDTERRTVFLAVERDGLRSVEEFGLDDFRRRRFDTPLRTFPDGTRYGFPRQPMIASLGDSLFFAEGDEVERWTMFNEPSYLIRPR